MTASIRDWRDDDAEQAAALLREVAPLWLVTPEWLRFDVRSLPARARHRVWTAEDGGVVVGLSGATLRWTTTERGRGEVWVGVAPAARRAGIGGALYERAEAHLAADVLDTEAQSDDGVAFAKRRGFRVTGRERYSELDLRVADDPPLEVPPGIEVVPLAAVLERPRDVHAVYAEARRDMPGPFDRDRLDYEEWAAETLASPLLDPEVSQVVLDAGAVVSFALILADRDGRRGEHELTGTLRTHRGRGLARLAKTAAIRACREAGIDRLTTSNDATNAPMLEINDRLGYRATVVATRLEKRRASE